MPLLPPTLRLGHLAVSHSDSWLYQGCVFVCICLCLCGMSRTMDGCPNAEKANYLAALCFHIATKFISCVWTSVSEPDTHSNCFSWLWVTQKTVIQGTGVWEPKTKVKLKSVKRKYLSKPNRPCVELLKSIKVLLMPKSNQFASILQHKSYLEEDSLCIGHTC